MLECGRKLLSAMPELGGRVELLHGLIPGASLPESSYRAVISNSLLHHLQDPQVLWQTIKQFARPEAPVFVMDLMRPASEVQAKEFTETYVASEPEILKRDFYHSLKAAYRADEIRTQLDEAGLNRFTVEMISDRHMIVWGNV